MHQAALKRGPDAAASPQLRVFASRRVNRCAVGREMAVVKDARAETAGPVAACGSLRPIGRKGYRVRHHDVVFFKVSVKW